MDAFLLVIRVGLSLGVVMVLLWMAQKRFSKVGRSAEQSDLAVVVRKSVGPKASVVVVESDGLRFMLGVTEHSVNVLHSSEAPEPAPVLSQAMDHGEDPAFAAILKSAGEPALRRDSATRKLRHSTATGSMHGSIFARSTWVQAGAAVRKGLNL
ncbi:flagellar biosynthetic protein FliO [Arthrobacter sp. TMP15]|uniref:FliO/MopB family protein n=1 Tax=Arthrobacter sp. TMP15 TaxID=3140789 RepID=UPI0031BA0087